MPPGRPPLRKNNNSFDDSLFEFLASRYLNDTTRFAVDLTNIFLEPDGIVLQEPYPKQVEFMNLLTINDFVVVVIKPRQAGFSTAIVARAVHSAFFGLVPEILILSRTKNQAAKILRRIRSAFNSMPDIIRPEFGKETQHQLQIGKDGTNIYSLPALESSCRGFTGDVYCDEFASFDKDEGVKIYNAVYPSTTKGFRIVLIFTPNGRDNLAYDLAHKTLSEMSNQEEMGIDSKKIWVPWQDVPHIAGRIDEIRAGMMPTSFDQEYNLKFNDEQIDSFFPLWFLQRHSIWRDAEVNINGIPVSENAEVPPPEVNINPSMYMEDTVPESVIRSVTKVYEDRYPFRVASYDPAGSIDGSIISVFGFTDKDPTKGQMHLLWFTNVRDKDISEQVNVASVVTQLFTCDKLAFDNTGGLGMVVTQDLKKTEVTERLIGCQFTKNWKEQMYSLLKTRMAEGRVKFEFNDSVIREFTAVQRSTSGTIGAVKGAHDDIPSTFIMALDAYQNRRNFTGFGFLF